MLYETDAGDLIEFAKRWAALGDAIADQVAPVVEDPRAAAGHGHPDQEVNPNAIALARERPRAGLQRRSRRGHRGVLHPPG